MFVMLTEAIARVAKPSRWRFIFALRSAITMTCLSLLWITKDQFNVGIFQSNSVIFGVWVFSFQRGFVGGTWKQAGRALAASTVAVGIGLCGFYTPHVRTTWYGTGAFLFLATGLVEVLTMAQVLGIKRPSHMFILVTVCEAIFISVSFVDILKFWAGLVVALPCVLILSPIVLWPRPANHKVLSQGAYIVNELLMQFALVQRLAFSDNSVRPTDEWLAKHRHKVLKRLGEMEELIKDSVDAEIWVGSPEPFHALHACLAKGWFIVTSMRSLVLDKPEWTRTVSPLASVFELADGSAFLELCNVTLQLLKPTAAFSHPGQILTINAASKLHIAVEEAYADLSSGTHPAQGLDRARYNAFLQSCMQFEVYLQQLQACVEELRVHMEQTDSFKGLVRKSVSRLWVLMMRCYVDSWALAWARLHEQWQAKAWHGAVRSALTVSTAGILSFVWLEQNVESHAYWIVITCIALSMDNLGQSLLKGGLRILGVLLAWIWAIIVLSISYNDDTVWIFAVFLWSILMAYIQQDIMFGYAGVSGMIAFYVVGVQLYGQANWSYATMATRAVMVTVGVVWSLVSFILIFPLDGMRDPRLKLNKASELCFEAFGEIVEIHHAGNMNSSAFQKIEEKLLKATMVHHQFEVGKFHTSILYHLAGIFTPINLHQFCQMKTQSDRVLEAIISTRLFLVMGVVPFDRDLTYSCLETIRPQLIDLMTRVLACPTQNQSLQNESLESFIEGRLGLSQQASSIVELADTLCLALHTQALNEQEKGGSSVLSRDMVRLDAFVYLCARAAKRLACVYECKVKGMDKFQVS